MEGRPIRIRFGPKLSVDRGKLLTGGERGTAVHAATFLRRREVVLDSALLRRGAERNRILVHELFHFVWLRLGNPRRDAWHLILRDELRGRARGELGWSSEWRKAALHPRDALDRTRRWREYACESFCDSAACYFLKEHEEFTLARRYRVRRMAWLARLMAQGPLSI